MIKAKFGLVFLVLALVVFAIAADGFAQSQRQASQRISTAFDKIIISDSTVFIYPVPENPRYYKVYDFSAEKLYVVFGELDEAIVHSFGSLPPDQVTYINDVACKEVSVGSDFKRFCSLAR